jgi:Domain of unknown function (DUF4145)
MRLGTYLGSGAFLQLWFGFYNFGNRGVCMNGLIHTWSNAQPIPGATFECPHCGTTATPLGVAVSNQVLDRTNRAQRSQTQIFACPACTYPTIFIGAEQRYILGQNLGKPVRNLPENLVMLYKEATNAASVGAYTACAMVARKILMNLAVLEGATENKTFKNYVDYLSENGFVPKKGQPWVDKIRTKGNEATHEIELISAEEAKDVMYLTENLLRFNFEMTGAP